MVPPKFQSSSGWVMGVKSTPEPMDHEPFSGNAGAGLEGRASEPGTYTNESSGRLAIESSAVLK